MPYTYMFQIAQINILMKSTIPIQFSECCQPFLTKDTLREDVIFHIHIGLPNTDGYTLINEASGIQIFQNGTSFYKVVHYVGSGVMSRITRWTLEQPFQYDVFVANEEEAKKGLNPLNFVELSEFLLKFNSSILHSAVISQEGKGILFTAPSGTGKSTQAHLWEKYRQADVLNGDRGIIRHLEGNYWVFGSPYAGSSKIYQNKGAEIEAIVVVRQAPTNKIHKLTKTRAYILLLSELSVSSWNKEIVELQAEWLLSLIEQVPVYLLECTPDEKAVATLYQELRGK